MKAEESRSLGSRSLAAAAWSVAGTVLRLASQLIAQIVLARIIGPEQYGIFAICVVVVSFAGFFADAGIASALVQRERVTQGDVRFAFSLQVLAGSAVGMVLVLLAEPLAGFFGEERAAPVIRVLALVCVINALAAVSLKLLARDMRFKSIQRAQVYGYFVGYILVAVPMAWYGAGVWSLVAAWLVQASFGLVIAYGKVRHSLRPLFRHEGGRGLATWGLGALANNLVTWWVICVDRIMVGRFLPTYAIGLYSIAYNLVSTPTFQLTSTLQQVLFSASARVQSDKAKLQRAMVNLLTAVGFVCFPVFMVLAANAHTTIEALYGPRWIESGEMLVPLCLTMPFLAINGVSTSLTWGAGRIMRDLRVQAVFAVVITSLLYLLAQHSAVAVAWGVLIATIARATASMRLAAELVELRVGRCWKPMIQAIGLGVLLAFAAAAADNMSAATIALAPVRLLLTAIVCAMVCLGVARYGRAFLPSEIEDVAAIVDARLPPRLSRSLRKLIGVAARDSGV